MEEQLRSNLIAVCAAYCDAKGAAKTTVAQSACGDWRFFDRLDSGASFTIKTYDRALHWFSDRWPKDVAWPSQVMRPVREGMVA